MKKILILGGGVNQLGLINSARESGYYTIVCDKNQNCLGKRIADMFYVVDIIDKVELIKIAEKEHIDGIVSNSEIAMSIVASISEKLGLPGNSQESIEKLESKHEFRELQESLDVFVPKHVILNDIKELDKLFDLKFPIVVKPVMCSGTRGTTRFNEVDKDSIKKSVELCINYSRNKKCEIEEYVEMPSLIVMEGDVFVCENRIFWGGMFFTRRSQNLPMVPMTYMSPYVDTDVHIERIKRDIQLIFNKLNIKYGQYNVEAYFDKNDHFFIIEINARQGGHGLPAYVKLATGVDMDRLLVTTAVGDNEYFEQIYRKPIEQKFATRHAVFSDVAGRYTGIYIDSEIEKYVVSVEEEKDIGDVVEKRINGSSVIGFVNLVFDSYELQHFYSENIENYIYPIVNVEEK